MFVFSAAGHPGEGQRPGEDPPSVHQSGQASV